MHTTFLILIITATVITKIVDFAKPAYEDLVGKYAVTFNIILSFLLGVCASFAIAPFLEFQLSINALVLLGLALGTGATIFYDVWKLVQNWGSVRTAYVDPKEQVSAIWYDLDTTQEEEDGDDI